MSLVGWFSWVGGGFMLELAVNPLRHKFCPIKDRVTILSDFRTRGSGWNTLAAASKTRTHRGGVPGAGRKGSNDGSSKGYREQ